MTVERYLLKNGIPVFIVENNASPVVTVQAWISRGSAYEDEKVAGISHFLEHSLFKGTKKREVGEIALEIESHGGEINAFTSFEETCYYTTLASRYFEEGLDIIADAVQNPTFDREEMLREREVILEEIKRAQDSPFKVVSTNLWATAFAKSPYGRPVLGYVETVSKIDDKTLRQYFTKHYHAGTTCVVIVGDVDSKDALTLATQKFGKMKKRPKSSIRKFRIPPRTTPALVLSGRDVTECNAQIAWPAFGIRHPEIPVWDLMCSAIGHGESGRLYQTLIKEKKSALETHMDLVATVECGMAAVSLQTEPAKLKIAITDALSVLAKCAEEGLKDRDIERVKSALESEVVAAKETVEGYARRLGYYYVQFGDPEYEKKYLESILLLEADDTTNALRAMLKTKPVMSLVHPQNMQVEKSEIIPLLASPKFSTKKLEPTKTAVEMNHAGTVRFIHKPLNSLPIISMKLLFEGGAKQENPNQYGLSTLFQRVWATGTPSYSCLQIAHTLESLGASVSAFSGRHTTGISLEFLSKQWPAIKPLFREILLEPTFPDNEFETEKELLLKDIHSERDYPGQVCQLNFMRALYGDHVYGRSPLGKRECVEHFTVNDLKTFYSSFIHRDGLIVSSVGNFEKALWEEELSEMFKELPTQGKPPKEAGSPTTPDSYRIVLETKQPLHQSHLLVGFLSGSTRDPERYAMKLLSSCLAGQGGRLFLELRDKQSLAYQVAPINSDTPERGMFAFYIGCGPEKIFTALQGMRIELNKVLNTPLSKKELDRAKQYWIGRYALDMQRYASQAMTFAIDEFNGNGFDHSEHVADIVNSVTADDIRNAAQKFLVPSKAVISIVHPEKLTEEAIVKSWEGRGATPASTATSKTAELR